MVTMLDVAKKAGVSKATVSRVLNETVIVSEAVKKRVLDAIEEIGYRPNLLARQLATNKTNLIGFVVNNELYNGLYFSSMVYHAASFSEEFEHQLILADGKHSAESERNAINFLLDMKCAGIVVYPQYLTAHELTEIINNSQTPIVVINRYLPNKPDRFVTVDHTQGAELLMTYILQQGHRDIAYIQGKKNSVSEFYRFEAYKNKLKSANIAYQEQRIVSGDWSLDSGYLATKKLLKRGKQFTALVCANDNMAFGAIKAFKEAGYALPNDVSIAGFDNTDMCEYVSPALTSVSVPINAMIKHAIAQILGLTMSNPTNIIKGELIIRHSVSSLI